MKQCKECGKQITRRTFCSKKCSGVNRTKNLCLIKKEDLIQEYVVNKLEMIDISIKYQISISSLFKYLKRYGIEHRSKYIDFTGKTIGKLYVIEPVSLNKKGGGKHVRWRCKCDCGNEHFIISTSLSRTLCSQCKECAGKQRRSSLELKKYIWTNIKRGAKNRGIEFTIDQDYAYDLFIKQDRKCALSGVDIKFAETSVVHYTVNGTTASLDRIDSSKPYIEGNVQWVHKIVNSMKNSHTETDFIEWCKKIVKMKG